MITLSQADDQKVLTLLPPATGRFTGWDWPAFYNAILLVLQQPASQSAYMTAWNQIANLPAVMQFTPQIVTAAWARFSKLYPYRDFAAALRLMQVFLTQTGKLHPGDQRQWWTVEQEWQALERAAPVAYIPFGFGDLGQRYPGSPIRRYRRVYRPPARRRTRERYRTTWQQGRRVRVRLGVKRPDPVYVKGRTYRPVTVRRRRRAVTRRRPRARRVTVRRRRRAVTRRRPRTRRAPAWWVQRNIRLQQDAARKRARRQARLREIAARAQPPQPQPEVMVRRPTPDVTATMLPPPPPPPEE